jgi:hypothetical protein
VKVVFSQQNFEIFLILNFMKIRQLEAEFFYADGRTDGRDEAKSRFS